VLQSHGHRIAASAGLDKFHPRRIVWPGRVE
jgi:hypothetical protein